MDEYPLGGTEGLHRPVKFPGGELLYGRLQVRPLPLQPGLWGKTRSLTECGRQLYRRARRLLQHQRFQRLEVPAAHMAGEAGDRGVGELQPLRQLPNGRKQEGICVGVDIIQDLLLRPGQFPSGGRKAQVHDETLILSKLFAARRGAAHWRPAEAHPPPEKGGRRQER